MVSGENAGATGMRASGLVALAKFSTWSLMSSMLDVVELVRKAAIVTKGSAGVSAAGPFQRTSGDWPARLVIDTHYPAQRD